MQFQQPVYATELYQLSSQEHRGIVFTHRDQYTGIGQIVRNAGLTGPYDIEVTTNKGNKITIQVAWKDQHHFAPVVDYYRTTVLSLKSGYHEWAWMIKGKNPKGVRSEFFTMDDLKANQKYAELEKLVNQAHAKFRQQHFDNMQQYLLDNLPEMAKVARFEVVQSVLGATNKESAVETVINWFTSNGFNANALNNPQAYFTGLVDYIQANKCLTSSWSLEDKPDGYGHRCGVTAIIDFANRKLTTQGWSSDD